MAGEQRDDLDCYLSTDPEQVPDVIAWWHERQAMFPCLSRMALDYLSIPSKSLLLFATWTALIHQTATSVAVERVFGRGRLMLSHVRNKLMAQSAHALLCLGDWSRQGFVKTSDLNKVVEMEDYDGEVDSDEEAKMSEGWDAV